MVAAHIAIARAVIEAAFQSQHNSMLGAHAFRRDADHTRQVIAGSRELLKRLRQHQRDDAAKAREYAKPASIHLSAFDADLIRSVFHDLVLQTAVPESQWRALAKSLVSEFTGCERIEAALPDWIISK